MTRLQKMAVAAPHLRTPIGEDTMSYLFEIGSETLANALRRAMAHSSRQTSSHAAAQTCSMHGKRHCEDQSDSGASDITTGKNLPELLLRWRGCGARPEFTYSLEILGSDKRP
jgi:hypothetical protein